MISVIIPVYNVQPYLDECIQSVIRQEYTDFECILVDDGSTDGSGQICDKWQKKDARIKVIHQSNQGVSAARNAGIEVARGEYITFIDSDDWVDANYLSSMAEVMESEDIDLVISGLFQEFNGGKRLQFAPHSSQTFELNKSNTKLFVELNEQFLLYAPYIKLYKSSLLQQHRIKFDTRYSFGEDLLFNYHYLEHVHRLSCIALSSYHYRIIGSNTLSSKLRPDQFQTDYAQWKVLKAFYERKKMWNEHAQALLYKRLWGTVYDGIFLYPKLNETGIDYLKQILSIPEIEDLKAHQSLFHCSSWIKRAILARMSPLFYGYFKLKKS